MVPECLAGFPLSAVWFVAGCFVHIFANEMVSVAFLQSRHGRCRVRLSPSWGGHHSQVALWSSLPGCEQWSHCRRSCFTLPLLGAHWQPEREKAVRCLGFMARMWGFIQLLRIGYFWFMFPARFPVSTKIPLQNSCILLAFLTTPRASPLTHHYLFVHLSVSFCNQVVHMLRGRKEGRREMTLLFIFCLFSFPCKNY